MPPSKMGWSCDFADCGSIAFWHGLTLTLLPTESADVCCGQSSLIGCFRRTLDAHFLYFQTGCKQLVESPDLSIDCSRQL